MNIYDYGVPSTVVSYQPGAAPDAPSQPSVTLTDTTLTISWSAPVDNNYAITKYRIFIDDSTGTPVEDTDECDGSEDDIFSSLSCTFTMSTLLGSDYNLVAGNSIYASV